MANKFVWSGAGGANDGSKWEDAYTTLMKDWGAEADFTPGTDFVYVRSTHDETGDAADLMITGTTAEGTNDPVRVLCVTGNDTGTDPGTLTTGATVNTNDTYDIRIDEKIYIYGVNFLSGELFFIGSSNADHYIKLESCRLELTSATSGDKIYLGNSSASYAKLIELVDTDFDFGDAGQQIVGNGGFIIINGGSLLSNQTSLINVGSGFGANFTVKNFDLSILTGNLLTGAASMYMQCHNVFSRCILNASATLVSGTLDIPGIIFDFHHCQSGTDSDPAYQMKRYICQGTVEADAARYRTGGASDGERTNPYSWSMDTSAGSNAIELYEPLESPPIAGWTDGDGSTAHTYRIYVASGFTVQDDEVWFDLIGPNDIAEDSLGVRKTTRPDPMATPANLTTDSGSTWNGADVSLKQYMDITYTPDKPGPITARIYLAKGNKRISVDPKIYIDPS